MSQEEESLSIFEEEGRNENRPRQNHQWLHPLKTAARNTHIEPGKWQEILSLPGNLSQKEKNHHGK